MNNHNCFNFIGYTYWLRGENGTERVVIIDGKDKKEETLIREDMKYEAKNYQITIAFLNDWYDNVTMYDRNVFFKI